MTGLATFNFKLSQLYPGAGKHHINTCGNPDCSNFGQPLIGRADRKASWKEKRPDLTPEQLKLIEKHGPGAYKLAGADQKHRRVSRVFAYQNNPHGWSDQRTVRCLGQTHDGHICDSGFSILSLGYLDEEIDRLRNLNGVFDGPSCGACGKRFLGDACYAPWHGSLHEAQGWHTGPARHIPNVISSVALHWDQAGGTVRAIKIAPTEGFAEI